MDADTHIAAPVLTVRGAPPVFPVMSKPTGAACNLGCEYCFFLSLAGLPRQRSFGQDKHDTRTAYCRDSDVRFACNGGCPKDRFATWPYGEPGQQYLCPGYKAFFTHVRRPMDAMAQLLREHRAPARLMNLYAAEDRRRPRNAPCTCGSGKKWKRCHGSLSPARS